MKISVSVPGKLMLFGEHAVVYGYPCIVSTINRFLHVTVRKEKNADRFITPQSKDNRFMKKALEVFRKRYGVFGHVSIETKSELGKYGLGSSAAVSVGLVQALAKLYALQLSEKECFDATFDAVLSVQGKASGFDVASCIWKGTIRFDGKSKKVEKLMDTQLPIVVGYSGVKGDTVIMIQKVAALKKDYAGSVQASMQAIERIVMQAAPAIKERKWETVGKLMNANHELLHQLGISTQKLDKMIIAAYAAGAYGAKLSGAGGGDCMIAIIPKQKKKDVEQAIIRVGGTVLPIIVG